MLQAHSFLWHYLWLAPHILQLGVAWLIWRRGLYRAYPVFFVYLIFEAIEEFTLYRLDLLLSVTATQWWTVFCIGLVIEGVIRFALIGELSVHLLRPWPALAKLGNRLMRIAGVVLVFLAAMAAAYAPVADPKTELSTRAHILEQTLYIVLAGLILFLFRFAAYFKLRWNHFAFGIALGMGVLSCEHLATWAITANGLLSDKRQLLDMLNMATYHVCVLIWFYYLLVPERIATTSVVLVPKHDLAVWNEELERFLHQ